MIKNTNIKYIYGDIQIKVQSKHRIVVIVVQIYSKNMDMKKKFTHL
jgi:protein associated with RNAse G/E